MRLNGVFESVKMDFFSKTGKKHVLERNMSREEK